MKTAKTTAATFLLTKSPQTNENKRSTIPSLRWHLPHQETIGLFGAFGGVLFRLLLSTHSKIGTTPLNGTANVSFDPLRGGVHTEGGGFRGSFPVKPFISCN